MNRIGIIGLGKMGMPIAHNLLERGFEVVGYRRSGADDLVAAGGRAARSPAELADQADVVLTILPDVQALEEVICGSEGTLKTLRPGTIHIEMSTIDTDQKKRLRDQVRAHGGDLLDCPISGSPPMVAPRLATTFVSGRRESVDRVRLVLEDISGAWVYTGPFGTGAKMKYLSNLLVAVHTVAAAEVIGLAQSFGLDLELVQHTLDNSLAASAILQQRGPWMRDRKWTPAPGPIATLHPILEQIAALTPDSGVRTPVFDSAKAVFDKALMDGWGEYDIAAVRDLLTDTDPATGFAETTTKGIS